MQNKGLVKLFAFLFGLVSIYQLSFTFKGNQIEKNAEKFAINKIADSDVDYDSKRNLERLNYLDSLNNKEVFNIGIASFDYKEVKEKAMNLGLDLKGGINVILQISVKDILVGLASDSKDPTFRKALIDAEKLQGNSQNTYLEDFFIAFEAIKGDKKLASPEIFANRLLSDQITFNMSDDEVKPILSAKIDESIVSAFEVLRKRIDKFGVTQPNIQRIGNSGRILVELPGAKEVERVKGLLQSTAQLEFWDAFKGEEFGSFLIQTNEVLKEFIEDDYDKDDLNDQDAISDIIGDTDVETGDDGVVNPFI
jgi:SecD/SecF fusion protein